MAGDSAKEGANLARGLLNSVGGGLGHLTCPNCGHQHQQSADEMLNAARAQRNTAPTGDFRGTSPVEAAVPAHLRPATRKMPDRY